VLAWVAEHRTGRQTSVWAVVRTAEGTGVVRLTGTDPMVPGQGWPPWVSQPQ
jgi:hypothetical protein